MAAMDALVGVSVRGFLVVDMSGSVFNGLGYWDSVSVVVVVMVWLMHVLWFVVGIHSLGWGVVCAVNWCSIFDGLVNRSGVFKSLVHWSGVS